MRLWDAEGAPLATLEGHTAGVVGATGLNEGRILSWSEDHTLRLWAGDGAPLATLQGHTRGVRGATALADARILLLVGDHTLRLWAADGTAARDWPFLEAPDNLLSACYEAQGRGAESGAAERSAPDAATSRSPGPRGTPARRSCRTHSSTTEPLSSRWTAATSSA